MLSGQERLYSWNGQAPISVSDVSAYAINGALGFLAAGIGAAGSTVLAKLRERVSLLDYVKPTDAGDHLPAFNRALAYLESIGGGVLEATYIGGAGYQISDVVTVDFSNVVIVLHDKVKLTKTTKASAFMFSGTSSGAGEIENVGLIAPRLVKIDGNASAMTGYTYSTADTLYSCVTFKWVKNFICSNIQGDNGLVNSLRTFQARGGIFHRCIGSAARWDNGISVDFDPQDYSDTNPNTWAKVQVSECLAYGNTGFGMTAYGSTAEFARCYSWSNGNNDPVNAPGPGGGYSAEINGSLDRNYRVSFLDCHAFDNYARSLFVSARGSTFVGGSLNGAKIPAAYTDVNGLYGNNVAVFGAEDVVLDTPNYNAARHGIYGAASGGRNVGVTVKNLVTGAANRGMQLTGVSRVIVTPSSRFESNGLAVGATQVDAVNIDNTGSNAGAGVVQIDGYFQSNGGSAARVQQVADVYYGAIKGRDNNANHSAQSAVFADFCGYVSVDDIDLRGSAQTTVITIGANTTKSRVKGVSGDYTSTAVNDSATTKVTATRSSMRSSLGDSNYTTAASAYLIVSYNTALTADRTVTLNATNPTEGDIVRTVRGASATGAFNLTVGAKVLNAASQWCEHRRTSSTWELVGAGSL
jgi:hypothetical protein